MAPPAASPPSRRCCRSRRARLWVESGERQSVFVDAGEDDNLDVTEPKRSAAGVPAVIGALRHSLREMAPLRTARTLAMVNQDRGFDCMGCAWPDPAKRHHAEFCENGAKAVADLAR